MNPPPIGQALSAGWNIYKANLSPVLIATFCATLLGLIPVVGGMLAIPGAMLVALKAVRGQTPQPADGFVAFQALVDHLVIGLLQMIGAIACCVGAYVTQGIFLPGTFLVMDKGQTWQAAK